MSKTSDLIGLGTPAQVATVIATNAVGSSNVGTVSTTLTATGTTITDALPLVSVVNAFLTVTPASGAKLPDAEIGSEITILNGGASPLNLYPPTALGVLNAAAAGAPLTIAALAGNRAIRTSATNWIVSVFALES